MPSAFLKAIEVAVPLTTEAEQAPDNQAVVILITGFVVVFLVLLLLIGIIKVYSAIVSGAQKKSEKKKACALVAEPTAMVTALADDAQDSDELDLQTVAVITAAVESFYSGKKVRIRDIRPVSSSRSSWATAGLMENIPAMRSEGLL